MTSGAEATNSTANLRTLAGSATPTGLDLQVAAGCPAQQLHRLPERIDAPLPFRVACGGGADETPIGAPGRLCARATSGHAAAAPPSSVMNSRRFIRSPRRRRPAMIGAR